MGFALMTNPQRIRAVKIQSGEGVGGSCGVGSTTTFTNPLIVRRFSYWNKKSTICFTVLHAHDGPPEGSNLVAMTTKNELNEEIYK